MDINIILPAIIAGGVTALSSILTLIGVIKTSEPKKEENQNKRLNQFEQSIKAELSKNRDEYLSEISSVKDSISDIRAHDQQFQAVVELKIDELSKRVEKHNQVVERTFILEKDVEVLKNRESVSEHRISDLEGSKA